MPERLNGTAWKAVPRKRPVGSNPTLSAKTIYYRIDPSVRDNSATRVIRTQVSQQSCSSDRDSKILRFSSWDFCFVIK